MIRCRSLYKSFGGPPVLEGFSLSLPDKGIACLLAPSGSGKTTLLHILAGLTAPDSGSLEGLEGVKISMVFQEDRLLPWLSAAGNIALAQPKNLPCLPPEKYLAMAGLEGQGDKRPGELSGGMNRRVAVLRALARLEHTEKGLLLLDEPFKGMDRETKAPMMGMVASRAQKDLILLVTHDPEEAAVLADTVFLCSRGPFRILEEKTISLPRHMRDRAFLEQTCRELSGKI